MIMRRGHYTKLLRLQHLSYDHHTDLIVLLLSYELRLALLKIVVDH